MHITAWCPYACPRTFSRQLSSSFSLLPSSLPPSFSSLRKALVRTIMPLISQNDVQLVRAPIRTFYGPESTRMCAYAPIPTTPALVRMRPVMSLDDARTCKCAAMNFIRRCDWSLCNSFCQYRCNTVAIRPLTPRLFSSLANNPFHGVSRL